jgi:flagellar basal-body rod modification protein FlgD
MSVSSVTNSTQAASAASRASTDMASVANTTLDKMAFLKLLITQIQYQDPMSPMDDTQFVSQLAQFSSLEQMQELNSGFSTYANSTVANQAYSLIGKWVDYADAKSGQVLTGRVNSVSFEDGQPKLAIGDASVDLANIVTVYPDSGSIGAGKLTEQAFAMIGKSVDYLDPATGNIASGVVGSVSFANGWPVLNIGSAAVDARDVIGAPTPAPSASSGDAIVQAMAMVGREISYVDSTNQTVRAKVDSMSLDNGVPKLVVGGQVVGIGSVSAVF